MVLHVAGEEADHVYNSFEDTTEATYGGIIKKGEHYSIPKETYQALRFPEPRSGSH